VEYSSPHPRLLSVSPPDLSKDSSYYAHRCPADVTIPGVWSVIRRLAETWPGLNNCWCISIPIITGAELAMYPVAVQGAVPSRADAPAALVMAVLFLSFGLFAIMWPEKLRTAMRLHMLKCVPLTQGGTAAPGRSRLLAQNASMRPKGRFYRPTMCRTKA
jgi:hypothetical protein